MGESAMYSSEASTCLVGAAPIANGDRVRRAGSSHRPVEYHAEWPRQALDDSDVSDKAYFSHLQRFDVSLCTAVNRDASLHWITKGVYRVAAAF